MFKYFIICIIALSVSNSALSQPPSDSSRMYVTVNKDYRLDLLARKQWEINKLSAFKSSSGKFKGYRVQVLNTNDRDLAYRTRGTLLRSFPNDNVYMAYQTPYYKLRIGDFVKKEDAEKFKKQVTTLLGTTAYVVPDLVVVTAEDQRKLLNQSNK